MSWGRGRRRAPALGFPPLPRPTAAGPGLPPTRDLPRKALQCRSLTSTPFLCTHRGGDGRKDAGGAHHWRGGAKKKSYLLRPKKNASQGVAGARRRMLKKGWVGWVGESLEAVAGRAVWRGRGGGGGRRSGGAAVGGGERLDGEVRERRRPARRGLPPLSLCALSFSSRLAHHPLPPPAVAMAANLSDEQVAEFKVRHLLREPPALHAPDPPRCALRFFSLSSCPRAPMPSRPVSASCLPFLHAGLPHGRARGRPPRPRTPPGNPPGAFSPTQTHTYTHPS